MNKAPSISVAMATYNGAPYIAAQLESLTKQTLLPTELVVCDDASTDGTMDIVKKFAETAPFSVRTFSNPKQLGYRENFMKATGMCRYELIAFCDQDDIWLPNKLASCAVSFANPKAMLTYHNATVTDAALKPLGTLASRAAPQAINLPYTTDPWSYGLGFTIVFRKSLMDHAGLWMRSIDYNNPQYIEAHDQWFFFLASSLGTINYIAQPLVQYRQHGKNTCGWNSNGSIFFKDAMNNLASTQLTDFERRSMVAARRAEILDIIGSTAAGETAELAKVGAAGYRKLEALYRKRLELYNSRGPARKLWRITEFFLQGSYKPKSSWGLGTRALVRDLTCAVFFPRRAA